LQLKKISSSKPAAEPSEPLETVEQGLRTNEGDSGNNVGELTVDTTKEEEVLENGVIKNDKKEARTTAKPGNKRKFPSREEKREKRKSLSREAISKAR
jgi:hypothetical protein